MEPVTVPGVEVETNVKFSPLMVVDGVIKDVDLNSIDP